MTRPPGDPLLEFVAVMRRLRAECPWKAAQTHRSLARYLVEETHETLEAIDTGAATGDWAHLREELGDLLLQVVLHAAIAEQAGEFTLDDVAAEVTAKMVRRNPHVFGGTAEGMTPEEVDAAWQQVKATEKRRDSVLDGIPPGLPALLLADKVLDRLSRRPEPPAAAGRHGERSPEQPAATTSSEEVGERLLALVADAREAGVDPEQALRDAVHRRVGAAEA